jgi:transmembrane sensor
VTPLYGPVKRVLRKTTTTVAIDRMWSRIEARSRTEPRASRSRSLLVVAAALVATILGVVALWRGHLSPAPPLDVASQTAAVLVLTAEHADDAERVVSLGDRSTITLAPGSAIEPIHSTPSAVALRQLRGSVLYEVTPGGPRRWSVDCGLLGLEVVGTVFRVDRSESRVRVEVQRGVVVVRGERVPSGAARLTAGTSIEVTAADVGAPAVATPPSAPASAPSRPAPVSGTWRELAARGENDEAYTELGPGGVARTAQSASVDDLLALSDVARLSGHAREAVDPLERIVREHPGDSRASLAAFTLGRIDLRSLGDPAAAARAFERAIALGIPGGLAEDAFALWVESLTKAGDEAGARKAHAQFVARFPDSPRARELETWVRDQ